MLSVGRIIPRATLPLHVLLRVFTPRLACLAPNLLAQQVALLANKLTPTGTCYSNLHPHPSNQ